MADDAKLIAVIEANTKQFENALKRLEGVTRSSTDRMTASVRKMDSSFAGLGRRFDSVGKSFVAGFLGSISVSAIQAIIKETVAWGDALGDLADQTGLTTKQIQVLRYAAKQTGSSAEQMDASLKKFGVTLGQARTKGNDLKKILDANGISLTDMAGKARAPSDILNDVIDLIGRLGDEQQKTALITAAFGAKNNELLTTFRNGLGPIEAWGKALDDTGIVSDDVISKLGELDNKFNDVMTHIQAVAANVVANMQLDVLLDYVSRSVDELADLVNIANLLQQGKIGDAVAAATTRGERRMTPEARTARDIDAVKAEISRLEERQSSLMALGRTGAGGPAAVADALSEVSIAIDAAYDKLKELMELREKTRKAVTAPATPATPGKPAVIPPLAGGGKTAGKTKTGIPLTEIRTKRGLVARVDKDYAAQFQGLIDELETRGYDISNLGEGGYSGIRKVRGPGTKGGISAHSYGRALDINPQINKFQSPLTTNLPADMADIAARHGLTWGGTWKTPDAMHFVANKKLNQDQLNDATLYNSKLEEQVKVWDEINDKQKQSDEQWQSSLDAITNANQAFKRDLLGGLIKDLEHGVKPAEALANALGKISDRLLDMALNAIFPDVGGKAIGGILGGLFAGGGVMTSHGPMPLRKYAGGGVANSPQMAMFGEGSGAEAYVPLPDGRRIPVNIRVPGMGGMGKGGGQQAVAVHNRITVDPSPMFITTTHAVARQGGRDAVAEAGDQSRRRPGGR